MEIHPKAPTRQGAESVFTGTVYQDPIIEAPAPARHWTAIVTFTPGARTHWHAHPLGQTLRVLSGIGRIQLAGAPVREIRPGDTVWIAPGEKHWHGAAPEHMMSHLAIQETEDGSYIETFEPVSDAEYLTAPA